MKKNKHPKKIYFTGAEHNIKYKMKMKKNKPLKTISMIAVQRK